MSLYPKSSSNNKEPVCPNAPKITIKPVKKRIPYLNVIKNSDSYDEEELKENPVSKMKEYNKENDDRYESSDDSFDEDLYDDRETQSQSGKTKTSVKKLREENPESIS